MNTHVSPCCGRPSLPPAVMPHWTRFCAICGSYFRPDETKCPWDTHNGGLRSGS